jgi:hypothetical protein
VEILAAIPPGLARKQMFARLVDGIEEASARLSRSAGDPRR